jgi:hypothetical protein
VPARSRRDNGCENGNGSPTVYADRPVSTLTIPPWTTRLLDCSTARPVDCSIARLLESTTLPVSHRCFPINPAIAPVSWTITPRFVISVLLALTSLLSHFPVVFPPRLASALALASAPFGLSSSVLSVLPRLSPSYRARASSSLSSANFLVLGSIWSHRQTRTFSRIATFKTSYPVGCRA